MLKHARAEGLVNPAVDPDATAALVVATFSGMFMLPSATTTPRHLEQALSQLESFIGIGRRTAPAR
jgi:hypothetical protein